MGGKNKGHIPKVTVLTSFVISSAIYFVFVIVVECIHPPPDGLHFPSRRKYSVAL